MYFLIPKISYPRKDYLLVRSTQVFPTPLTRHHFKGNSSRPFEFFLLMKPKQNVGFLFCITLIYLRPRVSYSYEYSVSVGYYLSVPLTSLHKFITYCNNSCSLLTSFTNSDNFIISPLFYFDHVYNKK